MSLTDKILKKNYFSKKHSLNNYQALFLVPTIKHSDTFLFTFGNLVVATRKNVLCIKNWFWLMSLHTRNYPFQRSRENSAWEPQLFQPTATQIHGAHEAIPCAPELRHMNGQKGQIWTQMDRYAQKWIKTDKKQQKQTETYKKNRNKQ